MGDWLGFLASRVGAVLVEWRRDGRAPAEWRRSCCTGWSFGLPSSLLGRPRPRTLDRILTKDFFLFFSHVLKKQQPSAANHAAYADTLKKIKK